MADFGIPTAIAHHALQTLALWAGGQKVVTLGHEPMNDQWSLDYDAAWVARPQAFALSPALPFAQPANGYAVGAVKRFVENLLPEGRALDITATTYRVSKANVQAQATDYIDEAERAFANQLRDFIVGQAARLTHLANDAAKVKSEFL